MFCTQCGQQNPDGSKFCSRCGAGLAPAPSRELGDAVDATSTLSLPEVSPGEGAGDGAAPADGERGDAPHGHPTDAGTEGDGTASVVEGLPGGSALLVVKRGPNAGSRFLLDQDVTTAGRHPDSEIFLDDVTVSRRHAEFVREGDGFVVRDVGSLNGTYLNRERIDAAALSGGDEVQIGKYRLVFLTGPRQGDSR